MFEMLRNLQKNAAHVFMKASITNISGGFNA